MNASEELAAAVQELEGEGWAIQWNGVSYAVRPGSVRREVQAGQDGELEVWDTLKVIARTAVFGATAPGMREEVAFQGRPYRIEGIEMVPGGGTLTLLLVHAA